MNKLKEILIPVAVVAVGVLGAFATQISGNSNDAMQTLVPGWIDNPIPCSQGPYTVCSLIPGEVCTIKIDGVDHILKGKENPEDSTCPMPLFRQ